MCGKKRRLLERKELGHEFGRGKGMGKPHCAEIADESATIYRIYTPGPRSRDDYLLKLLRSDYEATLENDVMRSWIQEDAFGFAILVETLKRREKLLRLIEQHGPSEIRIIIEVVPGIGSLAAAIRNISKNEGVNQDVSAA
jgi:hypothetical protein